MKHESGALNEIPVSSVVINRMRITSSSSFNKKKYTVVEQIKSCNISPFTYLKTALNNLGILKIHWVDMHENPHETY